MIKKMLALLMAAVLVFGVLSGCGKTENIIGEESLEGAHVFMFKNAENPFGDLMYQGFESAVKEAGETPLYKSPSETTVEAQVKMIDELIAGKVASITISANGDTGYDKVLKKAKEAGIKIFSADSRISPDHRITHIDQCYPNAIGKSLISAAVLIAIGIDYPSDGDMINATEKVLSDYSGNEIKLGVLSTSADTPAQSIWISNMEEELKKDIYKGKVSPKLDIKYGIDDSAESEKQANAFISEKSVDVIIAPTTVGMAAAAKALKNSESSIKLTGLGLPSEMQDFMPQNKSDNAFDSVCPYMMLWDVSQIGAVAGTAAVAAVKGEYDGKEGSVLKFQNKELITEVADDGGTRIISSDPYVFHKGNIKNWINKL